MVSFNIPVYNTSKKLKRCLRSVLGQTYKDWECIVVNNFSTDMVTIKLLKQWKSQTPNIIFVDKMTNEGVDKARFTGISMVKGDYVTFVDSDDWLDLNSLEVLVRKAEATGADLVVGQMCKYYDPGFSVKNNLIPAEWMERVITHEELI